MYYDVFLPNKVISRKTNLTLIVAEVLILLSIWTFIDFKFIPNPIEIWNATIVLITEQDFLSELYVSLFLNLEATALMIIIGLLFSYSMVFPFMKPVVVILSKCRFMSMVGWTFIFTLATSGSHQLKLSILVYGMMVFFITSMADLINSIPKADYDFARTLKLSELEVVWHVIVRGKAAESIDIIRQNVAMGWMMLTMVEGIARSEGGIGALLLVQNKYFKLDAVFAIQFIFLSIGLLQDYIWGLIKILLFPYSQIELGKEK